LVNSKIPVMVRKRVHTPNCGADKDRVSRIKLMNPKKVIEKRCRKV
jgi:hypothetical protein